MADLGMMAGYGTPPTQVIEQRGGGTLNFIRSVLESGESDRAVKAAKEAYFPAAQAAATLIDSDQFDAAGKLLARQRYELANQFGDNVAQQVVGPGFQYLVQRVRQGAGGAGGSTGQMTDQSARFDPSLDTVKLSDVAKNQAAGGASGAHQGLYEAQTQTENTMRPLIASGQGALTQQRLAGAGESQATAGYRSFQTNEAGPSTVAKNTAQANEANARANALNTGGGQKGAGQYPIMLERTQRMFSDLQDIERGGISASPDQAAAQLQASVTSLNTQAQKEGRPERWDIGDFAGRKVLVPGAAPAAQAAQPRPAPAAMPTGRPPAIPAIPQAPAPQQLEPQAQAPQQAAAPADVTDLSTLVPKAAQQMQQSGGAKASDVVAELAAKGITDPAQIKQILQSLAAKYGVTRPGQ